MEPRCLGTLLDFHRQGTGRVQAGQGGSQPFPVQAGGLPHIPHIQRLCQRVGRAASRESGCSTQVGWDLWDLSKCHQCSSTLHDGKTEAVRDTGDSGHSQLSPGRAQPPCPADGPPVQPPPPEPQPAALSMPQAPRQGAHPCIPGFPAPLSGGTGRTRYLRLHVPHVCKSLLLPLKMGLEGQGRDTGEKRVSHGRRAAERPGLPRSRPPERRR